LKVGIVIVSYNAALAVRTTLASVCQAKNRTPLEIVLVDNASYDLERQQIREAFERYAAEADLPWTFIQQEKNLGFAGGNNVGIRYFLDREDITHICLLNSDVIVTDNWLDRLLEKQCDIISAVTNKADSEQSVPVDYDLELADCLDKETGRLHSGAMDRVRSCAESRYRAWQGNTVETDVTFFCVILSKEVVGRVGLLDEAFFPGGFEDDDYCLRARSLGYRIHLARDVFIHHWGSASFGQLQYDYFTGKAQRNRQYLEEKHAIVWKMRPEKPFVSYAMDVEFALKGLGDGRLQKTCNRLYMKSLGALVQHYESESGNLLNLADRSGIELPGELRSRIAATQASGRLAEQWATIAATVERHFHAPHLTREAADSLIHRLDDFIAAVHETVECNFCLHSLIQDANPVGGPWNPSTLPMSPVARLASLPKKLWWMLKRGIPFLWNLRGIVFFGGYPYPERQSDGYFQRIQIIDRLLPDRWRVYVESEELPGRECWFDRPEPNVLVLRITGGPRRRTLVRALAVAAALRCRKIYFHSVLRMRDNRFGCLMRLPGLTKVIDIHGVVPEEFRLHNDFYSARLYEAEEWLAVRKSHLVVVVSQAMQDYLRQKYRSDLRGRLATFPMLPNILATLAPRAYPDGKPVVVYAGGLHMWQQVPKMIDAITRTTLICSHRFYCSKPELVRAMLPEALLSEVQIESKGHDELMDLYAECHYGFILRQDIVVNRVACPTKLVEYLATGIVPIVDCEDIGDFKSMGMQFVTLNELLQGQLPDEARRSEMARQNFAVYERLREVCRQGSREVHALLSGDSPAQALPSSLLHRVKRLLPPDSPQGRLARSVRRLFPSTEGALRPTRQEAEAMDSVPSDLLDHVPASQCDVLVQVDNFEAGGLENVVLDLNETLMDADYRVVLLVLGTAGEGVKRARERGIPVVKGTPDIETYRSIIDRLKPRLLLTHYSLHGAELCHERGIPFVQVIHNTYMWFNDAQQAAFARAARYTTTFVAVSEYAKRYSVHRLGVDESRCVVIPNGIDGKSFDFLDMGEARHEIRARHGLGDRDFIFLSVGSINHQKNHIATVRAFAAGRSDMPDAKLVILGPTYEKGLQEEMEQYIVKNGLGDRIIYAGASPGAQKYYAMADAFVTSSFFEGGPLNQLEAIRANLPSVMADIGFACYFKNAPGCEVVAPAVNIGKFRGAIWQLASTPEFEERLAKAMVRTYQNRCRPDLSSEVIEAFDKSRAYQCYVALVGDLLEGKDVKGMTFPSSWPNLLASAPSECSCAAD